MTEKNADFLSKVCIGVLFIVTAPVWIPLMFCAMVVMLFYTLGDMLCNMGTGKRYFSEEQKDEKW